MASRPVVQHQNRGEDIRNETALTVMEFELQITNGFWCGLGAVQLIFYAIYCVKKSFPDGCGKMVGVDGKPSGEDIQLGIRMGQNQSKEDLV
nr:bidirectional sugar transporter SWEET1-like [Ipomoea trifida]